MSDATAVPLVPFPPSILARCPRSGRSQGIIPETGRQRLGAARTPPREIIAKADRSRQASLHQERRRVGHEKAVWHARGRTIYGCCGPEEGLEGASQARLSVGCFTRVKVATGRRHGSTVVRVVSWRFHVFLFFAVLLLCHKHYVEIVSPIRRWFFGASPFPPRAKYPFVFLVCQ